MKKIIFLLIPILIIISITEFFLAIKKPNFIELDKTRGWKLKKNINYTYTKKNLAGENYTVQFSTDDFGMRNFTTNNDNPSDLKVLIFGDSFTSDPYASNENMWYSEIAKMIYNNHEKNISVHSIGAGGYGTLQELLSLKQLKTKIDFSSINFFIFQFCNNDFNNNLLSIEKKLKVYNQYSRRPYFENGQITYDNTVTSRILRIPFIGESRILNKFFFLLSKINFKTQININQNLENQKSIEITKKLISMIRKELNSKTVIVVNCDNNNNWQTKNIKEISKKNDFIYLNFPDEIYLNKKFLYKDGSHLSEDGNIYFGKNLYNQIIKKKLFKDLFSS